MMNKSDALKRLDAIETEAAALRKIIDGKIEYKKDKLYVGVLTGKFCGNSPYILAGGEFDEYFRFHYFGERPTEQGWAPKTKTAQECIDCFISSGGTVHEFGNVREGFEFFLANYKD